MHFKDARHEQKHMLPKLQLLQHPQPDQQGETRTVLIKRDGSAYSKRCVLLLSPSCVHAPLS